MKEEVYLVTLAVRLGDECATLGWSINRLGVEDEAEYHEILNSIGGQRTLNYEGWVDIGICGRRRVLDFYPMRNHLFVSEKLKTGLADAFPGMWNILPGRFHRLDSGAVPKWNPFMIDTRLTPNVIDWEKTDHAIDLSGVRAVDLSTITFRESEIPIGPAIFRAMNYPAVLMANSSGMRKMTGLGIPSKCFHLLPLKDWSEVSRCQ
jgi:hypothetical protein